MPHEYGKRKTRQASMAVIALAHLALAVIGMLGLLNFTVPPEYRLLQAMANSDIWVFIHIVASLFVGISLLQNRFEIASLSFSAGFMGVWAFFNLLWGLNAVTPVSLAGPVLGMAVSGLAYAVTMSWATAPPKGRF